MGERTGPRVLQILWSYVLHSSSKPTYISRTDLRVIPALAGRDYPTGDPLSARPGYTASHVKTTSSGLTAALTLAEDACDAYGTDLKISLPIWKRREARQNTSQAFG
ncbi:hypothetical protein F4802DRAFT_598210 [Xylaria palmicola]|nr:hypothetical protein F4802DRAFT_598210 [Xylaria palmicola]